MILSVPLVSAKIVDSNTNTVMETQTKHQYQYMTAVYNEYYPSFPFQFIPTDILNQYVNGFGQVIRTYENGTVTVIERGRQISGNVTAAAVVSMGQHQYDVSKEQVPDVVERYVTDNSEIYEKYANNTVATYQMGAEKVIYSLPEDYYKNVGDAINNNSKVLPLLPPLDIVYNITNATSPLIPDAIKNQLPTIPDIPKVPTIPTFSAGIPSVPQQPPIPGADIVNGYKDIANPYIPPIVVDGTKNVAIPESPYVPKVVADFAGDVLKQTATVTSTKNSTETVMPTEPSELDSAPSASFVVVSVVGLFMF